MERDVIVEELVRRVTSLEAAVEDPLTHEYFTLHVGSGAPVHNAAEGVGYWDAPNDDFYINGDGLNTWQLIAGGGGAVAPHSWLSASHPDTTPAVPQRGDVVTGQGVAPTTWTRLAHPGAAAQFLRANAADPGWAAIQAGDLPGLGGVPALTFGLANAAGAAATYVQTDASIAIFDANMPTTILPDAAGGTGAAAIAARRDHEHAIACDPPVDVGVANQEGTAYSFARSDHVHNHPAGLGVNLHHNEAHVINSTGPHGEAGLTIGHVLRASGAAAFSFAAIQNADVPSALDVNPGTCTVATGNVAATPHTHAITTSSNPGAAAAILASSAAGLLQLEGLGIQAAPVAGGITMADGTWSGIGAALERIVYNAAGFVSVMGANFGVGTLAPDHPLAVQASAGANAIKLIGRAADDISSLTFADNAEAVTNYIQGNGSWIRARADGGVHFRIGGTPIVTDTSFTFNGGNVGVGTTLPLGKTHVDQASTTGDMPVLYLDQADIDELFFQFVGTSTAGHMDRTMVHVDDAAGGTIIGYYFVDVTDSSGQLTGRWGIALYDFGA